MLFNYKSTKAQLLQIDLRRSLCKFVQSYAEYSGKMKKDNNASLEKFETLIFSGIVSGEDKFPSTFDGIEQIGSLVNAIKK
jgi:hypothetical protein